MPREILTASRSSVGLFVVGVVLVACAVQPRDVPELSDTVLCDIVAHRDTRRDVRVAAQDELDGRDAHCDRLTAVMRRQRMNGLRDQLEPEDLEENPATYTDCVLDPICQETQ
jgi:hypothetical protein